VASKEKERVPIRQIADELGISFHFLTKVLQTLTRHNIMVAHRGPSGGVALARPARDITLMELIDAIENEKCFDGCILQLPRCGQEAPCPLHSSWHEAQESINAMFRDSNLEELGQKFAKNGFRLSVGDMS